MSEYIYCSNCNKKIEKKGNRTLCIRCRNLADKIRIAERNQSDSYKEYQKQYHLKQKGSLI